MPVSESTTADSTSTPIFILGILPRCGTNFLYDLLTAHPDCARVEPVWEDFLLYHAAQLTGYTQAVYGSWNPQWGVTANLYENLLSKLGSGICQFLTDQAGGQRAVTKTPRTDHLDLFFKLFPEASLIILVRDGRSVVESGVQSFGWYRESANRHWAKSAQRILEFSQSHPKDSHPYCLVRYEDLWTDQEAQLRKIFEVVDLDANSYDFEKAASLPIRGSSAIKKAGDELHWNPVEKPKDFDPMKRFRHWGWFRHQRFNHLAGPLLKPLGYEEQPQGGNQVIRALINVVLDVGWVVTRWLGGWYFRIHHKKYRLP